MILMRNSFRRAPRWISRSVLGNGGEEALARLTLSFFLQRAVELLPDPDDDEKWDPAVTEGFHSWCRGNARAVRACAAAALKYPSISAAILEAGMLFEAQIRRSEFEVEYTDSPNEYVTVLQAACSSPGEPRLVEFILQQVREDKCDEDGQSLWTADYLRLIHADKALYQSCRDGLLACAMVLLKYGLVQLLNVEDQHDVLNHAILSKRGRLAVCLIDAGADVKQQWMAHDSKADDVKSAMMHDTKGSSALMEAAFFGLADVVAWCLDKGASLNMVNANADNALTLAARG